MLSIQELPGQLPFAVLRSAAQGARSEHRKPIKFKKLLEERMKALKMDTAFGAISQSGLLAVAKRRSPVPLQMYLLSLLLSLLDETDSGLDVDALRIVAERCECIEDRYFFQQ